MKHIQKLSLALLLATPFLGHADEPHGLNQINFDIDDQSGDLNDILNQNNVPKTKAKTTEVKQAAKIELKQAAQPQPTQNAAPTTTPQVKPVQPAKITIAIANHELPKKEKNRRKIEKEIFEKREELETVKAKIEGIKNQFPYKNTRNEPTSQILEAESLINGQKRIEKEFAIIEKRSWYIQGGAATLSMLSAAAYGAAKAGFRPVEKALERIPESETILMVSIPLAALLAIAAHNDLNKSQTSKNEATKKIEETIATKERLTELARDLEKLITEHNKLEAEIAKLESEK